jgi:hypothetical protein
MLAFSGEVEFGLPQRAAEWTPAWPSLHCDMAKSVTTPISGQYPNDMEVMPWRLTTTPGRN